MQKNSGLLVMALGLFITSLAFNAADIVVGALVTLSGALVCMALYFASGRG